MGGACKASKSGISLPVYYSFAMSCPWFCGMTRSAFPWFESYQAASASL